MTTTTTPTPDNLRWLLSECASDAPTSFRDQRGVHGFTRAAEILSDATAAGIATEPVLADFLRTGNADEAWLALVFLPLEAAVRAGLASVDANRLHEDGQKELRTCIGLAVVRGLMPYTTAFRSDVSRPGGRSLSVAVLVYDHAWAMANLQLLLGGTLANAKFEVGSATRELSADEVRALRDEFAKNAMSLPGDWAQELAATLDRFLTGNATFSRYVQGVRFTPIR